MKNSNSALRTGLHRKLARVVIGIGIAGWASVSPAADARKFDLNIAPDTIANELQAFYEATGTPIIYDRRLKIMGQGIQGQYTVEEAVTQILGGSGFVCEYLAGPGSTIIIRPSRGHRVHRTCLSPRSHPPSEQQGPTPVAYEQDVPEVVVSSLGTHIHGVPEIGSELRVWDLDQIRNSGTSNVVDLVEKMTQNFGGGPTQDTRFGDPEALSNSGLGSGANLRGLGSRSTLVLLNGRPIALSGSSASFGDLYGVPLSAVQKIEVLLDGASAIYGSEAVGGVINIHTKDEYVRPETFAEIGSVTDGRQEQHRASQEFGARWDDGNFVAVGEIMHRGALSANERSQAHTGLSASDGTQIDPFANPGNLIAGRGTTYPIPSGLSGQPLDFASLTPGTPNAADRYAGADIVPNQTRWSLFTSLHQAVGASATFFSDILWTERYALERQGGQEVELNVTQSPLLLHRPLGEVLAQYNLLDYFGSQVAAVNVRTLNATLGMQVNLPRDWYLVFSGSDMLETENELTVGGANLKALQAAVDTDFDPFGSGPTPPGLAMQQWYGSRSQLWNFAAAVDGPFLSLPAGDLHGAFGIEYRDQRFSLGLSQPPSTSDLRRQIFAGFGEIVLPLLDTTTLPAPLRGLNLSLAGRFERYSDFGRAATPRLGLAWSPFNHFEVRGTWARSVRAPNLEDLVEKTNASFVQPIATQSALVWTGGNADLKVERALTRTVGVNFKSDPDSPRFSAEVDYFDILYRDRIQPSAFPADILSNREYASFVTYNPSASARASVCSRSTFMPTSAGNCLDAPVDAIIDLRARNSATLWTDGFDIELGANFEPPVGKLGLNLSSTYILHYKQADTPDAPLTSLLNTEANPVALRISGTSTWTLGSLRTTLNLRYANGYRDLQTEPASRVASWTTADVRVAYTFADTDQPGSHPTEVALSCENLLNRYAPFAIDNVAALRYDPANGDLTGRVITLSVAVKW